MAQTLPDDLRARILLIAGKMRESTGVVHVERVRKQLAEQTGVEVCYKPIRADLLLHGYALATRGRPRRQALPGFSVAS